MLIYLLRHGLTEYNAQKRYQGQRDIPLSAEGLSQLRRADIDPKVVYITPLQRTAQTARPGAAVFGSAFVDFSVLVASAALGVRAMVLAPSTKRSVKTRWGSSGRGL